MCWLRNKTIIWAGVIDRVNLKAKQEDTYLYFRCIEKCICALMINIKTSEFADVRMQQGLLSSADTIFRTGEEKRGT